MKKYLKAIGIWFLIIPLAILNGSLRDYIIEPLLGNIALPLSGVILIVVIFIVAYFLIPKIGKCKPIEYLIIGIGWAVLTNLFDLLMIKIENRTLSEFFEMYDITTGNLWIVVVIVTLVTPSIVGKLKAEHIVENQD